MIEQILSDVKNYLCITFSDAATDQKLTSIIRRGMSYLQKIAGSSTLDFALNDNAMSLLLDYCLYANNFALSEFEQNYKSQLVALRLEREVSEFADETESAI
ncbi:MAG TPA: hypothetical protein DCP97_04295 [Ruminococcaceae bacterium]|nr:hypothetical protein [Oscillospiraceae bacterium]